MYSYRLRQVLMVGGLSSAMSSGVRSAVMHFINGLARILTGSTVKRVGRRVILLWGRCLMRRRNLVLLVV